MKLKKSIEGCTNYLQLKKMDELVFEFKKIGTPEGRDLLILFCDLKAKYDPDIIGIDNIESFFHKKKMSGN